MLKMLVCVDGSKQSHKAVEYAAQMSASCQIHEVGLICVNEPVEHSQWITSYAKVGREFTESQEEADRLKELLEKEQKTVKEKEQEKCLEEAAEILRKQQIEPELIAREGHPAHVICETAEKKGYDLILIGSRGLSGMKKVFLGSVSHAVIQEAQASVLVVK